MKKLKKVQINGNIFHLHKFQGFMLLKYPYCPKPSRDSLFSSVQLLSRVWLFATPWTAACQASLSITNSDSCPFSWWCNTTISSSLVPFSSCPQSFRSIRVFSIESVLHIRWPKYWSFSFSINPSIEYSGLISFKIDWLDLLSVQGTLKSLLQHYSSKASVLRCSAFFIVQLSHLYTYWKNRSFD